MGHSCRCLHFPVYESLSSGPVRMYLNGELGKDPNSLSAYQASILYAADRLCSFKSDWEEAYNKGEIIICDRYTQSNIIYQSSKIAGICDILRDSDNTLMFNFIKWVQELEYSYCQLPKPNLVIYLNVSESLSKYLMSVSRASQDILESDTEYQRLVRKVGTYLAKKLGWYIIECENEFSHMRSVEDIQKQILDKVLEDLF